MSRQFFTGIRKSTIVIIIAGIIAILLLLRGVSQSKLLVKNTDFVYDSNASTLNIQDNRTGRVYPVQLDKKIIIDNSIVSPDGLLLIGKYTVDSSKNWYNPVQLTIKAEAGKSAVSLMLELTSNHRMNEPIYLEVPTPDEQEQFFVIPYAEGLLIPAVEKYPFNEFYMWGYKATLPFTGVTDLTQGLMVISENPWDTSVKFVPSELTSNHNMQIKLWPSKESFTEVRKLVFATVENDGYVAMAKLYHQHRNGQESIISLNRKAKMNPNTGKLVGACDFWLLKDLGDKSFIDRLITLGVRKAIFSFYESWYVHDQDQNPGLIQYAADLGFLTGRYDIDTDVWDPKEIPSHLTHIRTDAYPVDVVVKSGGEMQKNWVRYLNGKPVEGYTVCSSAFWHYGEPRIGNDLIRNSYNTRFFDSILSLALLECYSSKHPTTRYEDMIHKKTYLQAIRDKYGLIIGSEDIRDYAVNQLDYNEGVLTIVASPDAAYSWLDPVWELGEEYEKYNMDATRRIPLFQLVYHGSVASTWYTGDSISKVPAYWQKKDLFTVLYGCMPLIMPQNRAYWDKHEAEFLSSIHLTAAFFESVGSETMLTHQFISKDRLVQRTVFANGWEVIANFSDQNITHKNYTLPPNGFYATNGKYEIYRVLNESLSAGVSCGKSAVREEALLDVVILKDRLFINPYGQEVTVRGTTTEKIFYGARK
ncbi:MAG: hypothetical protein KBA53_03155 [Thermoclostridium sp.]|nr:hypothetical protein [Thermoclostridium sp.]